VTDNRQALISELREILQLSGKQLQRKFHGSPLLRARPFGLRRNAIIVATNQNLKELSNDILFWQKDAKLKDLVDWSLKKLAD
jgi:epoxyqueuosine reductase QueG